MNEAQTELELIDPALKAAGWSEVEQSTIRKQFPITALRKPGDLRYIQLKADYVLRYRNRNLAVVEAKAEGKYYTEGVAQAKDYGQRLQIRFVYSTNGRRIYEIDLEKGQELEIDAFPGPLELFERLQQEENYWKERLLAIPFEDRGGTWQPRYYQQNAVDNVIDALAGGQDRMLLTLATGTGKTAIAFQIAWKLFHARWNLQGEPIRRPRILFLADRNVLANQAFNAFGAFEDDARIRIRPGEIRKKGHVPTNGSVFFTIFQTFNSGPDETPYFGQYPEDFFDFIIIDECHRGGANDESSWRAILEYFSPAVQLGLTATPRRDVNGDTYRYFGEPVYEYSLKQGINDGFLSPFKVKEIDTTLDEYIYTDDDELEEGEIEEGREYTESDFNRVIEIRDRERYRVELLMSLMPQNQKTLVFCATQLHALAIRDLINQLSDSNDPDYCHRVTADDGKYGEQKLDQFQDNERMIPTILTTSRKLSTGVDAPEVRNIVLLRPIHSMVEFKQIVGRGTRLYEGKDYFTIYDFVEAHEHFNDPAWDGPPLPPDVPGDRPPRVYEDDDEGGQVADPPICYVCGQYPCVCEKKSRQMIRIKLADHKYREIDSMVKTTFWSPDGKPISAEQFMRELFGEIPELFRSEEELRQIWSAPNTRKQLLGELSDRGFSSGQLNELQAVVHGEDSDIFDVLKFVAYNSKMMLRKDRASRFISTGLDSFSPRQQEFISFVVDQYVHSGSSELDDMKLAALLQLKYHSVSDAKTKLGDIPEIRDLFIDFQRELYAAG